MKTGRHVFMEMGIDPDNYLCLNYATTGVKPPIGVLQVSGRFGQDTSPFRYFIIPEGVIVNSDLNYPYTRISRSEYDDSCITQSDFCRDMVPQIREASPSIVLINNSWWNEKVSKDAANSGMSAFFAEVSRIPAFPVSEYEAARRGCNFTVFTDTFEMYFDMLNRIKMLAKQTPREHKVNLDEAFAARGGDMESLYEGPEEPESDKNVEKMVFIWENIINNQEENELWIA